ncbi:hypothetical protein PGN35_011755 [Nodosilinea sp. PGN35]|uniref:hypothetical protein n=1 Tax=Nodosilinea sp. PGN35 TaxID=3020489 RepID=UPI0023B2D27F|nr:hypothetical protein [Nodosilinea sp. TSF1-S3]MDF0366294.1 hypothetical protein [Nodosilinea sp. TSF1-S3]
MIPPHLLPPPPSSAERDRPSAALRERTAAVAQPPASHPMQHFFVVLPALAGFFGLLALIFVQVLISQDFLED